MKQVVQRAGEWWVCQPVRRGWVATCAKLELQVRAATFEALMLEIDVVCELLV